MKVLQINAVFGTKSTGTIVKEIQHQGIINGIESYVAYSTSPIDKRLILNGYQIGGFLGKKWHAVLSRIAGKQAYYSRIATCRFLRWVNKVNPDIVHLHNLHSNFININTLLRYLADNDIPTVITMHDCWYFTGGCFHYSISNCYGWKKSCGACPKRYQDTPAYLYDASRRILYDRIRFLSQIKRLVFVGCSDWIVSQLRQSQLKNIGESLRIYNGFDLDVFKPIETDLKDRLGLKGKMVLLGPSSKWHMPENKLALDYFAEHMPNNVILLLFGSNETKIDIHRNIGYIAYASSPKEMAELYSMADVMVNCSYEDTLSSLNLEAQACGTPVVTYDSTGSKETVDGVCGFAVETGNYECLFNTAIDVIINSKIDISYLCRRFIQQKFDKFRNYKLYIDLYKDIYNK